MFRSSLFLALLATAAACAPVASRPRPSAPAARVPVGDPAAYAAAGAVLHPSLRLCPGGVAYNVGPVSIDNGLADYVPTIGTAAGPLLRAPTEAACVSSGYGYRPTASGGGRHHLGVDLMGQRGSFIFAAGPGRVTTAGWRGSYGLFVEIDHGRGVRTRYGHMSELSPAVRRGALVAGGAAIGRMGATGNATGVHLHYEVLAKGTQVDPLRFGAEIGPPAG